MMKLSPKTHLAAMATFLLFSIAFVQCAGSTEDSAADNRTGEEEITDMPENDLIPIDFLEGFTFSEPVNYKNLQVFMVSGTPAAESVDYVPLKRAMENDMVELIETSDVNELEISNHSEETIYINSGDIIKGGKQDRTLAYDVIVGPKSKHVKLASFCVESGRWSQREGEDVAEFSETTKMLSSRDLKIASKKENEQSYVWSSVSDQQTKLSSNVSEYYDAPVNVQDATSETSLELALDNEQLNKMRGDYLQRFQSLLKPEHVGIAYAINGELYNVDIYNNQKLFQELFEKLLVAAVTEAIAELDSGQTKFTYITVADLQNNLKISTNATDKAENLNKRTRWLTKEDDEKIIFTSLDRRNESIWVHRNIIIKGKEANWENLETEMEYIGNEEQNEMQLDL